MNLTGFELRVPTPADVDTMWRHEAGRPAGHMWRLHGTSPSLPDFTAEIWTGVLHQFVVVLAKTSELLGVVSTYDYDPWSGHCKLGLCSYSPRSLPVFIGAIWLIEHVFSTIPINSVYFEVQEDCRSPVGRDRGSASQIGPGCLVAVVAL